MIKKALRNSTKSSLIFTKKTAKKVPVIRKLGVKTKNILFPELAGITREIYNYNIFYPTILEYNKQKVLAEKFKYKPLISIILPTYNTPDQYLRECLDSVLVQSYSNWELCVADDASPNENVVSTLQEYATKDNRIRFVKRETNGHISEASNSAIKLAKGKYIALLDHDDILWPNALFEIVSTINENTDVDFIYTDEDKIDETGSVHAYPFFKPDWSPEFLESCNYITHFSCISTELVKKVGGFRKGYEGAQDWDLFVRVGEVTDKIIHIPKLLYSWRIHDASTAHDTDTKPYVYKAQRDLLVDHVARINMPGKVKLGIIKQHSIIDYDVQGDKFVSLLFVTDNPAASKRIISKMLKATQYSNIEILVVSSKNYKFENKKWKLRVIDEAAQNPAFAYNQLAKVARGEYFVFADDSIKKISINWLEKLLGDAQRDNIGTVGGKTLRKKRDIFSAGITIGPNNKYINLLNGISNSDNHYLRGLYSKSRRNSLAIPTTGMMVKSEIFLKHNGFNEKYESAFGVDFCLRLIKSGLRNIYNPSVEITLRNKAIVSTELSNSFQHEWQEFITNDPFYNVNLTRRNAHMETKHITEILGRDE